MNPRALQIGYCLFAALCLTPYVSGSMALVTGVVISLLFGQPFPHWTKTWTHRLLQISIIGLGAGMNLHVIGQVGLDGIGYTAFGILLTFFMGTFLGKVFGNTVTTSLLITVGTAICGGSAIAAVASTVRAKATDISVSLAVVFLLNALALLIFPSIGHWAGLSEGQFGLWSALAIHDTSSVVGAAVQYGPHAAEIATTIKLARALWIIPISLAVGAYWNRNQDLQGPAPTKRPWFILGFLMAAALVTWIPGLQPTGHFIQEVSKKLLTLTLFFIGSGLTRSAISQVGVWPFLQGISLWFAVSSLTLFAILEGWIHP